MSGAMERIILITAITTMATGDKAHLKLRSAKKLF